MAQQPARFLSLDVFRGLAVCLMIVVNTAGDGAKPYPILVHARWFGFTAADWVFPSFLFAVGAAMAFSFRKPMGQGEFAARVLRRAALIFLLGFLMYWYPFVWKAGGGGWEIYPFDQTRVMGVLQRIALCYAIAAFAVRYLKIRSLALLCVVLLVGYWRLMFLFGDPAEPLSKMGNAGTKLDLWLLGPGHLYKKDGGFDPEGLLGTIPATVNVIAGYLAARFLQTTPERTRQVLWLSAAGLVLAAAGLAWSPVFPIAKKLWTSSYVLFTTGSDLVVLALLVALLEGRPPNPAVRFFQVFGRNPLVIYLFSELFVTTLRLVEVAPGQDLYNWISVALFQAAIPGAAGSLACAVAYMLVCWLVGLALDKRGVVIRA